MFFRPSRGPRLLVSLVLLLVLASPATATERVLSREPRPTAPPTGDMLFVPDELLVTFEPTISVAARAAVLAAQRATVQRELTRPGLALVRLPAGSDVHAAAAAFLRRPGVSHAEPNFVYQVSATPNDPRFADLWGLHNADDHDIDAPAAWNITTGSLGVVVAVVDSGVDYNHPDLTANIWRNAGETIDGVDNDGNGFIDDVRGWDFVGNDNSPMDQNGHGTHVAGTIGARGNNGAGITGVNWRVSLMALRAGNAQGSLTNADIIDSFEYACDNGARVINGSFGGPSFSQGILSAIQACPQALFVFAAGNGGSDGVGDDNDASAVYPCSYAPANIVCVAATDSNDDLTSFSNFGAGRVDLAAPGQSILSATHTRVLFRDGFESGLGSWVANKTSGKSWSATNEASAFGSSSATDSAGANYDNNSNTWIETASPVSLASGSGCALDYMFSLEVESNWDALWVEGSANGGSSWSVIDSGASGDASWSGTTQGAFVAWTEDLGADGFAGAGSFDLRFRLESDASAVFDGAHVDEVVIRCLTGTHGPNDYVRFNGTSMAAPHVAGVAALVLAAHPNLTAASVKAAILDGVDSVAALAGAVATGGRLNALGSLTAVESVRPVAFAPRQRLVANATLTTDKVPVRVSWAAATDAAPSSGIFRYQVQRRTQSGGSWGGWTTVGSTGSLSVNQNVAPGTHQFRVRAQDRAGNWSTWKAGSSFVLRDPQGGAALTFGGTWSTQTSSVFYDGSSRFTGVVGRTARHDFTGRQVAWVASRGPNRGRAAVYVDGALVATVNLYAGSDQHRRVVFQKTWSSVGAHSIRIKVISKSASSSGSRVDLDAYLTLR